MPYYLHMPGTERLKHLGRALFISLLALLIILPSNPVGAGNPNAPAKPKDLQIIAGKIRCESPHPFNNNWDVSGPALNIRDLGAKGDGQTNDTAAFRQAAQTLAAAGGGKLFIPAGIYIVGKEFHEDGVSPYYQHMNIFELTGVNGLIIEGEDGAVMRMTDGLHLGAFHPNTGKPYYGEIPDDTKWDYRSDGGGILIGIHHSQNVIIRGLELDGRSQTLILGGYWGHPSSRQCDAYGILMYGNRNVLIENIYTHHHGLDGIEIGFGGLGETDPPTPYVLKNIISEYNTRQALSWVGGIGLTVMDSKFNHTGRVYNPSIDGFDEGNPGAGLDIEAENAIIRDGLFCNSEFINNAGAGMVADSGDSAQSRFVGCTFWGTTDWSVWSSKPGMVFKDCRFYGSVTHAYGSIEHPEQATKFTGCHFEDKEHPDYGVFRSDFVLNMNDAGNNVTFEDCEIVAHVDKSMWITNDVAGATSYFRNCTVTHKNDRLDDKDWQAVIRHVNLEKVHFREEFPDGFIKRYYLNLDTVTVGDNVVVDGPVVRWEDWENIVGTIPPGVYTSWD